VDYDPVVNAAIVAAEGKQKKVSVGTNYEIIFAEKVCAKVTSLPHKTPLNSYKLVKMTGIANAPSARSK
jgi:hypothetical protein